jgi:hypothetical protein
MNLLQKTTFSRLLIFSAFILLHILFFNINAAEWGDSYRILRASEFIKTGEYPADEKRPPLFSLLLSTSPNGVDQIFFGRIFMFAVSLVCLILFDKLAGLFIKDPKYKNIALILYVLNPVIFYWSLRIYADVPLLLFVLLGFYFLTKWKNNIKVGTALILGLIGGLSVLLRFEGYLLAFSLLIGIIFSEGFQNPFIKFKRNLSLGLSYLAGFAVFVLPYILWKNPFKSAYFEEPAGRAYNMEMVLSYFVSLLFLLGFTSALFFLFRSKKQVFGLLSQNTGILVFMVLELVLVLLWPAAIPRIFIPIVPFLIILTVFAIKQYFEENPPKVSKNQISGILVFLSVLAILLPLGRIFLKLQFLVIQKEFLVLVFLLQIPLILAIFKKNFKMFSLFLGISALIWMISPVILHKDIYLSVKNASEYTFYNVKGFVGYNDKSSVSDWYINNKNHSILANDGLSGEYYQIESNKNINYAKVLSQGYDYLLLTNEHNTSTELDIDKRPYLEVIKEFRYNINGTEFFTMLLKVNKEFAE